ncbi:MAG: helix-turn-helix domain-containing protein [Verrucomicrobiota bacterium]
MNLQLPHAALLETIRFTGLSGEQTLLATLVSKNPSTHSRTRIRARALLLLNDGATVIEAATKAFLSTRSVVDLIRRFSRGGLCHALLGAHATPEQKVWLALSPSSPERVQLKYRDARVQRSADAPRLASVSGTRRGSTASRLTSGRSSCRLHPRRVSGLLPEAVLTR